MPLLMLFATWVIYLSYCNLVEETLLGLVGVNLLSHHRRYNQVYYIHASHFPKLGHTAVRRQCCVESPGEEPPIQNKCSHRTPNLPYSIVPNATATHADRQPYEDQATPEGNQAISLLFRARPP